MMNEKDLIKNLSNIIFGEEKIEKEKPFPIREINNIEVTLMLHSVIPTSKGVIYKCSLNNGKNDKGEYLHTTAVSVLIDEKCNIDEDVIFTGDNINEFINVTGRLAVEYKGKYTNLRIFATKIEKTKRWGE